MAKLPETPAWESEIHQLEESERAKAGPGGVLNVPATQLANRTRWLKDQIESASDYREYTFYKTESDPDGTIAGLANTPDEKMFRVAQGVGDIFAFRYFLKQSGSAIEITNLLGVAAITTTVREFPSLPIAQNHVLAGMILPDTKFLVTNSTDTSLADEYINNAGIVVPTGRKIPSKSSVLIGSVDSWINSTLYPFGTVSSMNENLLTLQVAAVSTITYREAYAPLTAPVASGDIITVRYKCNGAGGIPTIGLKTSLNGLFVSNQVTLTASSDWQEIQLTATAATATLLAVWVNTRLATDIQLSIIAYSNNKNAVTAAILNAMDNISSLSGKTKIGAVNAWVNNSGYPFSTFRQANDNRVNYGNAAGVYSEMYANITVAAGASVTLSYSLGVTSGRLFARLANGSAWTGDEVQLAGGGARQTITLVAAEDTKQLKIYTRAEISAGSFFAEVNYGQKNALTEQINSLYSAVASAN
ncbi:TPA: hypothetical protein ACPZYF_003676, partial [Klebsiella pneumoniae]